MLTAAIAVTTSTGISVVDVVVSLILLTIAIVGSYYLIRGKKASVDMTLADSAITSLQGTLTATTARLDLLDRENLHLRELKDQQDREIEGMRERIKNLEEWVTARDLIAELIYIARQGFIAQGVDAKILVTPTTNGSGHQNGRKRP